MTVVINELGMAQYFAGDTGPWGRWLRVKADAVEAKARNNAEGAVIGIQSEDLLNGLEVRMRSELPGATASIGTNASHRQDVQKLEGFTYPGWHDARGNRAWLTGALEDYFPTARRLR